MGRKRGASVEALRREDEEEEKEEEEDQGMLRVPPPSTSLPMASETVARGEGDEEGLLHSEHDEAGAHRNSIHDYHRQHIVLDPSQYNRPYHRHPGIGCHFWRVLCSSAIMTSLAISLYCAARGPIAVVGGGGGGGDEGGGWRGVMKNIGNSLREFSFSNEGGEGDVMMRVEERENATTSTTSTGQPYDDEPWYTGLDGDIWERAESVTTFVSLYNETLQEQPHKLVLFCQRNEKEETCNRVRDRISSLGAIVALAVMTNRQLVLPPATLLYNHLDDPTLLDYYNAPHYDLRVKKDRGENGGGKVLLGDTSTTVTVVLDNWPSILDDRDLLDSLGEYIYHRRGILTPISTAEAVDKIKEECYRG